MSLLYVFRHGQASFGNERYDQLSQLGVVQARLLGRFLRKCEIEFDFFFSGPKNRQTQTAFTAMAEMFTDKAPQPIVLDEFSEYDAARIIKRYFEMEGYSSEQAIEKIKETLKDPGYFFQIFKRAVRMWFSGDLSGKGLESRSEFKSRVVRGLSRISMEKGENLKSAIFTSGGVIAAIVEEATGIAAHVAFELAWNIRNASISVFEHRQGNLKLLSFNSVAHLELECDPKLVTLR